MKHIEKINSTNSKDNMTYYKQRVKFQENFIRSGKTYFDYKKLCDIPDTHPELQTFFNAQDLNEYNKMSDIIIALSNVGLRLKDIVDVFPFHKKAIIDSIPSKHLNVYDNSYISEKMKENMDKLSKARLEYYEKKIQYENETYNLRAKIAKYTKAIHTEVLATPKDDVEINYKDILIKKKNGWITAGNKVKFSFPISKAESVFGREEIVKHKKALGLQYGQYVDIDTYYHDKKNKEMIKKEKSEKK